MPNAEYPEPVDITEAQRRAGVAASIDEQFVMNYGAEEEWDLLMRHQHEHRLHYYRRGCPLCPRGGHGG